MPKTWANLLFPQPSSDVVAMSCATVFKITAVLFPVVNSTLAFFFAFWHFQKNLTFFL